MLEFVGFELSIMYTMPLPWVVFVAVNANSFALYTPGLSGVLFVPYRFSVLVFQSPIFVTMVQACVIFRS